MAKSYEVAADWRELDPESLNTDLRTAYEQYKRAQRQAATDRETFETLFAAAVPCPPGQRLAFGYRFGKLSIAVIPDDKPARKPSTQAQTLADFMRSASLSATRT